MAAAASSGVSVNAGLRRLLEDRLPGMLPNGVIVVGNKEEAERRLIKKRSPREVVFYCSGRKGSKEIEGCIVSLGKQGYCTSIPSSSSNEEIVAKVEQTYARLLAWGRDVVSQWKKNLPGIYTCFSKDPRGIIVARGADKANRLLESLPARGARGMVFYVRKDNCLGVVIGVGNQKFHRIVPRLSSKATFTPCSADGSLWSMHCKDQGAAAGTAGAGAAAGTAGAGTAAGTAGAAAGTAAAGAGAVRYFLRFVYHLYDGAVQAVQTVQIAEAKQARASEKYAKELLNQIVERPQQSRAQKRPRPEEAEVTLAEGLESGSSSAGGAGMDAAAHVFHSREAAPRDAESSSAAHPG